MSDTSVAWHAVCELDEIDEEDLIQFEHGGQVYAVYHTPSGFYATDGICTHEAAQLADGLVLGEIIECPRHQGRFDIPSGKAKGAPVCIDLRTYPTKVEAGQVYIGISTRTTGQITSSYARPPKQFPSTQAHALEWSSKLGDSDSELGGTCCR